MLILFTGDIIDCLTGDILCGDKLLAILFTGDIIDWRYFVGDILLAIFLPYTIYPTVGIGFVRNVPVDHDADILNIMCYFS